MVKKLLKIMLLVLMLLGAIIAVNNFVAKDLHSGDFKVVTYYPDEPDCYGDPKDCNDFTRDIIPD